MPFDISRDERLRSFAGTIVYEKKLDDGIADFHWLDLGKVEGASEVFLDGIELGNHWYGRHIYSIPGDASGKTLTVKLATIVGNYILADPANTGHGWVRGGGWAPVGVLGPVRLL
jgi:hypothetical protein